ncbi:hypothetical protein [Paenibacillus sp. GCM10012303]|uniref:hypothetical protein n=1 Tax=Paenibacillus sp. GCM10012303 TaxID=3317340 RepID=UPI003619AEB7
MIGSMNLSMRPTVKKLLITGAVAAAICTSYFSTKIYAAAYTNADAFFKSGFSSVLAIKVWSDSAVSSLGYSSWVSTARVDYAQLANSDIGFANATSESDADLRFYAGDYYWATYAGACNPYLADHSSVDLNQDPTVVWAKAHILINDGYMDNSSLYTDYQRQKVVGHELGHALSLKHQPWYAGSIMEQGIVEENLGTDYRHPTQLDSDNLAWKY